MGEWKCRIKQNSGRKRADRENYVLQAKSVPIQERRPLRRLAGAADISVYMVVQLMREGILRMKTTRIKPKLTPENKLRRVEYALAFVDPDTLSFEPMYDMVHIDEKWFHEDTNERSFLLFEGEEPPPRCRQSKHFVPKTMFLATIARPRFDPHRQGTWDGKIGIWPLTEEYIAQRSSKYRAKGDVCTRNIESITRAVYKCYLLEHVIPAIKLKWPRREKNKTILIQQDSAKPHLDPSYADIVAAGTADGCSIRLIFQPPNSPDMNVLDLGLLASLRATQLRVPIYGIDARIDSVLAAYNKMSSDTLDNVFLTLQQCMESIIREDGSNEYKLPHLGKTSLEDRAGFPKG